MKEVEKTIDKISKKNGILLCGGNWLSNIGNKIFDYANSILLLTMGEKAVKLMALYQGSETLISILFNLFGGVMADGGGKKRLCIVTDIIAACICFSLVYFLNSPEIGLIVIIANSLLAVVGAFNSPIYKSIVRELICKERIMKFNSIMHAVNEAISLVAPILGLCMVKYIGVRGALLLNGITFGISALFEVFLKVLPEYEIRKIKRSKMLKEIINGFKYMINEKWIFLLVGMSACINFFLSAYNLSLPFTENMIEVGFYSKVLVAEAIGGMIGSIICSMFLKGNVSFRNMMIYLGLAGCGLIAIPKVALLFEEKYVILILFITFSIFMTIYNINFFTYVQNSVEKDYLGRIFSIINTVALIFVPLGAFVFSHILKFDNMLSYFIVGWGIICISLIALLLSVTYLRKWIYATEEKSD